MYLEWIRRHNAVGRHEQTMALDFKRMWSQKKRFFCCWESRGLKSTWDLRNKKHLNSDESQLYDLLFWETVTYRTTFFFAISVHFSPSLHFFSFISAHFIEFKFLKQKFFLEYKILDHINFLIKEKSFFRYCCCCERGHMCTHLILLQRSTLISIFPYLISKVYSLYGDNRRGPSFDVSSSCSNNHNNNNNRTK